MPAANVPNPVKLPQAPERYDVSDQNRLRRMLELAIRQTSTLLTETSGDVPLATDGDLLTRSSAVNIALGIGTVGKYLRSTGTLPAWSALLFADMTYTGLTTGTFLKATGATTAAFTAITAADVGAGVFPGASYTFSGAYLDIAEVAEPASPSAGYGRLYMENVHGETRLHMLHADGLHSDLNSDATIVVRNTSGVAIAVGEAVYITGATGNVPNVAKAKADSTATMPAIGVAKEAIADTAYGIVATDGEVAFDTSSYAAGAALYVSAATAGALTSTAPTYPNLLQRVGNVMVVGVGTGRFLAHVGTVRDPITAADVGAGTYPSGTFTYQGHLLFSADNTYDIGATGATRPRSLYLSTGLFVEAGTGAAMKLATAAADIRFEFYSAATRYGYINTDTNVFEFMGTNGASVYLGVGGTKRWQVNTSGHLLAFADNTYDIGASGATRPRTLYLGTDLIAGGTGTFNSASGTTSVASGQVVIGGTTITPAALNVVLKSEAGKHRQLFWHSGSSERWLMRANSTAESGSDAGSNFEFIRFLDDASFATVLSITRSSGTYTWGTGTHYFNSQLVMGTDNTYDIGASGLSRPRNVYIGTSAYLGTTLFADKWADKDNAVGYMTVGDASATDRVVQMAGTPEGAGTTQFGGVFDFRSNSAATSLGIGFYFRYTTTAASYTQATLHKVRISESTKGAGSTITTQVGLFIEALSQGGTNYAIATNNSSLWGGHDLYATDNTYDIGASGANRPRTAYIGTSLIVGSDPGSTLGIFRLGGTASNNYGMYLAPSVTAASAVAACAYVGPTLTAAANNDSLRGVQIAPTFTPGAFTGVATIPLLINDNTAGATAYSIYAGLGIFRLNGHQQWGTDNTYDIGGSGANRPRTGYFGTSIITGTLQSPAATSLTFTPAGTSRWIMNTSGHLVATTDNQVDIGTTTNNRPANIYAKAAILSYGATSGIGYGTGAGGTATQGAGAGKATGVTLNTVCGAITMNNAALAGDTTVSFTLTNSAIATTDLLLLNHDTGGTAGSYLLQASCGAGSAVITVRNITTGSLSEAIVIRFAVIKGVDA